MTDRERQDQWLKEYFEKFPYGEQDEFGNDLNQLRENLKLTPLERLQKHDRAAMSMLELMRARENHRRKRAGQSA